MRNILYMSPFKEISFISGYPIFWCRKTSGTLCFALLEANKLFQCVEFVLQSLANRNHPASMHTCAMTHGDARAWSLSHCDAADAPAAKEPCAHHEDRLRRGFPSHIPLSLSNHFPATGRGPSSAPSLRPALGTSLPPPVRCVRWPRR